MRLKKYILLLMLVLLTVPMGMASTMRDDDDRDSVMQQGVRRLHPERERAKAMKKLQEQMSHKAQPKADPWDMSDEVWGTVDVVPVAVRDSAAVVGRRLTDETAGAEEGKRMTWQDEPVPVTIDWLMPYFTNEGGEWRSKYVSTDSVANEVYFAFSIQEADSLPGPLRLCIRYCGSSPLEYDLVAFTVEGYDYMLYPAAPRHGRTEDGLYWAASDDEMRPAYRDLIYAVTHGNWALIKLQGTGGVSRVKVLTEDQLGDMANTVALYRLMGGEI